ncbi:MAG: hypothetical protein U0744_06290 [Gemmataceae bacterium]
MSTAIKDTPVFNRLAEFFCDEPKVNEDSQRTPGGTFRNGNRGGPGNPYARRVAKLRQAVMEECTEDDLREVTRSMINLAKRGDKAAAKLVFQYALGKPDKQVDPDRIDEHELSVLKGVSVPPALLDAMLSAVPADTANRLAQNMWPALMQVLAKQLDEKIVATQELRKQIDEDDEAWEALPAEERLRQYQQLNLTPSPELVEEAAKERAAREAKEKQQAPPSTNGVSQETTATGSAGPKASDVASPPSQNGFCVCPPCGNYLFDREGKPIPTADGASRDAK